MMLVGDVADARTPRPSHSLRVVSETWSFSFADPRGRFFCHGRDGRALLATDKAVLDAELAGEGPFRLRGPALGELELEPLGPPVSFEHGTRREWICRGSGRSAKGEKLDGYGAVAAGPGPLAGVALRRTLWLCIEGKLAISGLAERVASEDPHGAEWLEVHVARGTPIEPSRVADPRLSTTYDAEQRVLRAGLELWEDEIEGERERGGALRLAGETVAGGDLEGVAVTFMVWHRGEGQGVGCYTIERA